MGRGGETAGGGVRGPWRYQAGRQKLLLPGQAGLHLSGPQDGRRPLYPEHEPGGDRQYQDRPG